MTKRPSWNAKQRAEIFRDNSGECYLCKRRIAPGEEWHAEHPKARGLGGSDKQEDMRPAHVDCHKGKTKKDRAIMAKADRQSKKHHGTQAPKAKIQSAGFAKADREKTTGSGLGLKQRSDAQLTAIGNKMRVNK